MSDWSLDGDSLAYGALRLAVQRIGRAHWRPRGALRSWGVAPLHREGERLVVPSGDDEALWIGAWLEPPGRSATVSLADQDSSLVERIELPPASRITALAAQPLVRNYGQTERTFELRLGSDEVASVACIELVLIDPHLWMACSGRPLPPPLDLPPPLPPRLG